MYLATLEIENFRNLNQTKLSFHEHCNYLIGENSIGKSNLLALIQIMTSGRRLVEGDFFDIVKPVKVRLEIVVTPHEELPPLLIKAVKNGRILLEWEQVNVATKPRLYEVLTTTARRSVPLKTLTYMAYFALKDIGIYSFDTKEESFYEELRDLLGEALDVAICKKDSPVTKSMSLIALRIRQFQMVMPHLPIYMIIVLAQLTQWPLMERGSMTHTKIDKSERYAGFYTPDALRLVAMVVFRLVQKIFRLKKQNRLESRIVVMKGKRYLPLAISLDEVETHLNPLMQRAMVDYFKEMMANENIGFLRILKDVFGIDGILGQVFIVTHSAEVLSDDYRQIIRFYRQPSGSLKIACGVTFEVSSEAEEHLIAYFSAVKEALYTRCVMIVEGETEYSSFRQFAKTLGIPLDFYGIGLINARGQGSISRLAELFNRFDIPVIALYDRDVRTDVRAGKKQVYFTDTICYEYDLVSHLIRRRQRSVLDNIVRMVVSLEGGSQLVYQKSHHPRGG